MNNTEDSMDLSIIMDIKELKSLAYDQLVAKELAERNLQAINSRMEQIEREQRGKIEGKKDK
jgi:hypothetical protein